MASRLTEAELLATELARLLAHHRPAVVVEEIERDGPLFARFRLVTPEGSFAVQVEEIGGVIRG